MMAKVADVFLNGTIGNVVFYRRIGTNCGWSRALNVKQSAATKNSFLPYLAFKLKIISSFYIKSK